jgi:stearoyl-CoA desaturase (delta-9 desaturase)
MQSPARAPINAPINWPAALMLAFTSLPIVTVLPWYLWAHHVSAAAWIFSALLLASNGMSITAGYHRLWGHRAYAAHPALKWLYAIFGAMAVQNSILIWATAHRVHHRHVDDVDHDPYSAKRGFWFSHIGWMLRDYPSSRPDFARVPDLLEDKVVMAQHRHYLWFVLGTNFGIPISLGFLFNDIWGFVLIAGFLRLVVSHHFTFFINSLAHAWGRQPFTGLNTARDNDFLALFTWGEGYHNYHHLFQWDYRNGVRWWQFDPTKWLIASCAWLGLARDLKRVPDFKIQRARVARQFERAREALASSRPHSRLLTLQTQLENEWTQFSETVAHWTQLQSEKLSDAKLQMQDKWEHSELRQRLQVLAIERALRVQRRRVQSLRRSLMAECVPV